MKKILFLFIVTMMASIGYAQKSKAFDAESYLNDFNNNKDVASLKRAKESIDIAAEHPDTKDNLYVLITKGKIYLALYEESKKEMEATLVSVTDEQKKALQVYESTPTNDLAIAYQAYEKAKQLDVKNKYSDDYKVLDYIGMSFDYSGRAKFNAQKYKEALSEFELAYSINNKDTTVLYLCAVSADYSENYTKAKEYYNKMIETKQAKANNYLSLANTYYLLKDTAGAVEILKKGIAAYPSNANILTILVNHYLKINKGEEVLNDLNTSINSTPKDVNLYLLRGNVYDNIASKIKDAKDSATAKNYSNYIQSAENDYLKVLASDSSNFYALFNLGVLYFNKGVFLNNKANEITDIKLFNDTNAKVNDEFNKALPLLEKASRQQPDDTNALMALKQIYTRLKMDDKLKIVNEKLKK